MNNLTIHSLLLRHEQVLNQLIESATIPAERIKDAITYSLFPGGKRLRPLLVYLCGNLLNVPIASLDIIAAAIELTHCYSLVHDDLPSMDNDDMRRGKASCHRAFDEATAILVGDGLQALAIELLLTHLPEHLSMAHVIHVTNELVKASGPSGMVSGQSLDLSDLCNPTISKETLTTIHTLKTGKLISACIEMVIIAGNPEPFIAESLRQFASHLGLVFQMQDDYLDYYNGEALGKGRASDVANNKMTFANLYNQEDLSTLIESHFKKAEDALIPFENKALDLLVLMGSLLQRSKNK